METTNKWEVIGGFDVWADKDGNGLVCPFCKQANEMMEVDLQELQEEFEELSTLSLESVPVPNMGPGGYQLTPVMINEDEYVLISSNWLELGVFVCGDCGGVWTADNSIKQLPGYIQYGSRGWVKEPEEISTKPWDEYKHLFGYVTSKGA